MINKKNLWFLTLFSLILVLSVYYITMPNELLLTNNSAIISDDTKPAAVTIEESETLTTLRVKSDEQLDKTLESLKEILSSSKSSASEKNEAFEKIKSLNENKTKETDLEKAIDKTYKLKSYVKIDDKNIKVTISSNKHNTELANKIMRTIQENFDEKMNITIEFQK